MPSLTFLSLFSSLTPPFTLPCIISGPRPPPPPPASAGKPKKTSSPARRGTLLYDFKGDKKLGEMSYLRRGEEVMEVTPDKEGWTLVRNSKGSQGNAPTSYIGWQIQGVGSKRIISDMISQNITILMKNFR